jgi:hypothetical protein
MLKYPFLSPMYHCRTTYLHFVVVIAKPISVIHASGPSSVPFKSSAAERRDGERAVFKFDACPRHIEILPTSDARVRLQGHDGLGPGDACSVDSIMIDRKDHSRPIVCSISAEKHGQTIGC